eukprot:jgi/Mesvir1/5831/Mv00626-RA.1
MQRLPAGDGVPASRQLSVPGDASPLRAASSPLPRALYLPGTSVHRKLLWGLASIGQWEAVVAGAEWLVQERGARLGFTTLRHVIKGVAMKSANLLQLERVLMVAVASGHSLAPKFVQFCLKGVEERALHRGRPDVARAARVYVEQGWPAVGLPGQAELLAAAEGVKGGGELAGGQQVDEVSAAAGARVTSTSPARESSLTDALPDLWPDGSKWTGLSGVSASRSAALATEKPAVLLDDEIEGAVPSMHAAGHVLDRRPALKGRDIMVARMASDTVTMATNTVTVGTSSPGKMAVVAPPGVGIEVMGPSPPDGDARHRSCVKAAGQRQARGAHGGGERHAINVPLVPGPSRKAQVQFDHKPSGAANGTVNGAVNGAVSDPRRPRALEEADPLRRQVALLNPSPPGGGAERRMGRSEGGQEEEGMSPTTVTAARSGRSSSRGIDSPPSAYQRYRRHLAHGDILAAVAALEAVHRERFERSASMLRGMQRVARMSDDGCELLRSGDTEVLMSVDDIGGSMPRGGQDGASLMATLTMARGGSAWPPANDPGAGRGSVVERGVDAVDLAAAHGGAGSAAVTIRAMGVVSRPELEGWAAGALTSPVGYAGGGTGDDLVLRGDPDDSISTTRTEFDEATGIKASRSDRNPSPAVTGLNSGPTTGMIEVRGRDVFTGTSPNEKNPGRVAASHRHRPQGSALRDWNQLLSRCLDLGTVDGFVLVLERMRACGVGPDAATRDAALALCRRRPGGAERAVQLLAEAGEDWVGAGGDAGLGGPQLSIDALISLFEREPSDGELVAGGRGAVLGDGGFGLGAGPVGSGDVSQPFVSPLSSGQGGGAGTQGAQVGDGAAPGARKGFAASPGTQGGALLQAQAWHEVQIATLAAAGRVGQARAEMARMKAAGFAPTIATYTSLIKGYDVLGDVRGGLAVLNEIHAQGLTPSTATLTALASLSHHDGDLQRALGLWQLLRSNSQKCHAPRHTDKPSTSSGPRFSSDASQPHGPDGVHKPSNGSSLHPSGDGSGGGGLYVPDARLYSVLLSLCARVGDLPRALELWDVMTREDGVAPTAYTYSSMFTLLGRVKEGQSHEQGNAAGTSGRRKVSASTGAGEGTAEYSSKAGAKAKRPRAPSNPIRQLWQRMVEEDRIVPTQAVFRSALAAFARSGNVWGAQVFARAALQQHPSLTLGDQGLAMLVLACGDRADLARKIVWAAARDGRAGLGQPHSGIDHGRQDTNIGGAQGEGGAVNARGENPVESNSIDSIVKPSSLPFQGLEMVNREGAEPTETGGGLNVPGHVYPTSGNLKRAPLPATPGVLTYNHLISVHVRARQVSLAHEIFSDMLASGIKPDGHTFGWLLRGCASVGDVRRALATLERMVACGIEPQRESYGALVKACVRAAREDASSVDRAFGLVGYMAENGLSLPGAYSSLISACREARQPLARAFSVLPLMRAHGVVPDAEVFHKLMRACAAAGEPDRALGLLNDMASLGLAPGLDTFHCLVDTGRIAGSVRTVDAALEALLAEGLEPDGHILRGAALAHAGEGNAIKARALVALMRQQGVNPGTAVERMVEKMQPASGMSKREQPRGGGEGTVDGAQASGVGPAVGRAAKGEEWAGEGEGPWDGAGAVLAEKPEDGTML